jgi:hypothetical protein
MCHHISTGLDQKQSKSSGTSGQSAEHACPVSIEAILVDLLRTALRLPKFAGVLKFTPDIQVMQEHCVFCSDPQGWILHLV